MNKKGIIELFNKMDHIAADYITSESFTDMHNLLDDKYCSKLVILTTDILSTKLKPHEVSYLDKRIKMGTELANNMIKEDIAHFNKNTVDELDVKDVEKKKGMCKGIAKFYIKLAHVYGAIVTAMNPVYEYKDSEGKLQQITLDNRDKLSDDIVSKVSKISNFCNQRIVSLSSEIIKTKEEQFKKIKPDLCSLNKKDVPDENGETKTIIETSGFKELERLYMDEYVDGEFKKSASSKKKYDKDVKRLDIAINGIKGSDPPATDFSTIKLNPFHNMDECKSSDGLPEALIDDTSTSFKDYGELIRKMIKTSEETQVALLGELKQMFSFEKENGDLKAKLQEDLNQYKLDKISKRCRDIIINMYINCEEDFIKGLEIYQAIVEELKYDILEDRGEILSEKPIEIQDIFNDISDLSSTDDGGNENYSKSPVDDIKKLIESNDVDFNSLFQAGLKYDDPELKKIKEDVRNLIEQDKNKIEINAKIDALIRAMFRKDYEKSKKIKGEFKEEQSEIEIDESTDYTPPFSDALPEEYRTQTPENKKNDIENLLKYLKHIKKILPLLKEINNKRKTITQ